MVQGTGWDLYPLQSARAFMEVQSHFSLSGGRGRHLTSSLFPAALSLTRLNPKASAWAEPRGSAKLTSLSFCWVPTESRGSEPVRPAASAVGRDALFSPPGKPGVNGLEVGTGGGLALFLWVIRYLRCPVRAGSQQVGGAGDSSPNPVASVAQLVVGGGGAYPPAGVWFLRGPGG